MEQIMDLHKHFLTEPVCSKIKKTTDNMNDASAFLFV